MEKICPYPGLRPFTEQESVFFKGRDLHVKQIIHQLEEKKILMVTGASGDGKSSLVYAGVIPNVRAGFFRAQFNNWLICDFRPERSPLQNLAKILSYQMGLDYKESLSELEHGFSSLVALYKSSPFCIDYQSELWLSADEKERKKIKRSASNILILADQFEEFFTNTENYAQGKPSEEAYITINLLLETARIAIRENLPIYIVCTMRSDYISDCVAFKGLPEMIGFSQFFVPRLKRNELQQVIEEPAMLSGGTVSKRLSEILINELREGFDQLPVLQHALNQLWKTAKNGDEELDLLHLAKIAGLPKHYLPEEDQPRFDNWFAEIENFKHKYFEKPTLANVLNTHADTLYQLSYDYFSNNVDWAKKNIGKDDAKLIIRVAFQSLTKIDEGRGVRNRVTINEITRIINRPEINSATVCGVLNVFRLQDNTFVRPFINSDNIEDHFLSGETILDITHEALIRNWELLKQWEENEFDNLTNFQDFKIQLNRWVENKKSSDYLLPIGPLSHFEKWYEKCQPNKYWISKYDLRNIDTYQKHNEAEEVEESTIEFIEKSKLNLLQIEKSKRRIRWMGFITAIVVILALLGFSYWALDEKAKAQEQKSVAEKQTEIAQKQREKAEKATELAGLEKQRAELSAKRALAAKQQSDSAKMEAEYMRILAEEKSKLAKLEATRANDERKKANEQRTIAERERHKAEKSSQEAMRLSKLAIAQSAAYKATNKYYDDQLNILLALESYQLNENNGGKVNDPTIFEALRFSLANVDKNINLPVNKIPAALVAMNISNGTNEIINSKGALYYFDNKKNILIGKEEIIEHETVENAICIDENIIVFGKLDFDIVVYYKNTKKQVPVLGYNSYIRDALIVRENNLLIADRAGELKLWDLSTEKAILKKQWKFNDKIIRIHKSKDDKIFIALSNGEIHDMNLSSYKNKLIYSKKGRVTSFEYCPDMELVVSGYADGELIIFKYNNGLTVLNRFSASNTMVDNLKINDELHLLAVSTSDKLIKLYNLDDLNANPLEINNHHQKIISLAFDGSVLMGLGRNKLLYRWETNQNKLSHRLKGFKKRGLSQKEKEVYIGDF